MSFYKVEGSVFETKVDLIVESVDYIGAQEQFIEEISDEYNAKFTDISVADVSKVSKAELMADQT